MTERDNDWIIELKKFIKQDVIVKDMFGTRYEGQCKAINYMHLNIVLMTDTEKIIIKNPQIMRRKRDTPR